MMLVTGWRAACIFRHCRMNTNSRCGNDIADQRNAALPDGHSRWAWFCSPAPLPVAAAPFCVQTQAIPPQCIYFDARVLQ